MKAYLWTTAAIFALVTIAHLLRIAMESAALARDPWYVLLTVLSAGLCAWALRLLRAAPRA